MTTKAVRAADLSADKIDTYGYLPDCLPAGTVRRAANVWNCLGDCLCDRQGGGGIAP